MLTIQQHVTCTSGQAKPIIQLQPLIISNSTFVFKKFKVIERLTIHWNKIEILYNGKL